METNAFKWSIQESTHLKLFKNESLTILPVMSFGLCMLESCLIGYHVNKTVFNEKQWKIHQSLNNQPTAENPLITISVNLIR